VSRRSKRSRGPQRSGGEAAAETRGGEPAEGRQTGGERSRGGRTAGGGRAAGGGRLAAGTPHRRAASGWSLGVQLALLVAVFAVVVLVAELAGAANLGVALGVGQIAFAIAVIYLLVRH
jgi:hypothetical protein